MASDGRGMLDGVLVLDKPAGLTSHDVVAVARRVLGQRRVGHTGTLDPLATGVLALLLGRATRLSRFLTAATKHYVADVRLGVATDTYDADGTPGDAPTPAAAIRAIDQPALEAALAPYRGRFEQVPPPFSAKKVAGVRAYTLARRGVATAPRPVTVTVHTLRVVSLHDGLATLDLTCAAGFYVRVLAHDLGQALGVGAHLERLRRLANGELTLAQSISLDQLLEGGVEAAARALVPLDALLGDCPAAQLTEIGAQYVRHGRTISAGEIRTWVAEPPATAPSAVPSTDRPIRLLGPNGQLLALATTGSQRVPLLHPAVVLV